MKEYNTYIFDLDGTLLDTLTDLHICCNHVLRSYDMPERSYEEIRCFVGNGVRKLIERAVPKGTSEDLIEKVLNTFKAYYMEHGLDHTRPYEGIIPLLQKLKESQKRIAVVSNKFDDATKSLCKRFFNGYIDIAIGEKEGTRPKPAPDAVNQAITHLGLTSKSEIVYIGDSEVDFKTAQNCELPCISVLWGFRDKAFLEGHGAQCFINLPNELLWE